MHWILIYWISVAGSNSVNLTTGTAEFNSRLACQQALAAIKATAYPGFKLPSSSMVFSTEHVRGVCTQKEA